MNKKSRFLVFALVLLVLFSLVGTSSAAAQTAKNMSVAEFRAKFTEYMAWLDSNASGTSMSQNLEMRVQAMSDEEFQAVYDSFADPDAFIAATERVMAPVVQAANILTPRGALLMTALYPPDYPTGAFYDEWVAGLPGLGLISDGNGDGSLKDERCSFDGEAGLQLTGVLLKAGAIVGDVLCNSIVVILGEGTNLPFCVAAGLLHAGDLANDTIAKQCDSQDANVNSAEIEAAYENSKIISGQLDGIVTQIETHDTDLKTALATHDTDLKAALATHDTAIKTALATHDTAIKTALSTHDAAIKAALHTHDVDIKAALATHDADIKAALAAHDAAIKAALLAQTNLIVANQGQSVKIEIETTLSSASDVKRLSYFYLPLAKGGLLEIVRQTVLDAITANQAAGMSISNAQTYFAQADTQVTKKNYKAAYDLYKKSYLEILK
jgi:hypothetical protein